MPVDQIPPQGAPFTYQDPDGNQRIEQDWYLFLYKLWTSSTAILTGGVPFTDSVNIVLAEIDALAADVAAAGGSSGTVTHTAGALTANAVVLGNGAADVKVDSSLTVSAGALGGVTNIGGSADAGAYSVWGGLAALNGGYVQFYGGSHATNPNQLLLGTAGTTRLTFDATTSATFNSRIKATLPASTASDVAASYASVWQRGLGIVDSTRTADNKQTELIWTAGVLQGRFLNDAYGAATAWLQVTGGQAAGVTSIVLFTGASAPALAIDASQQVSITTTNSTQTLTLTDTGGSGANLRLNGNGVTNPNKYIRCQSGVLQVMNSAYSAAIFQVNDDGSTYGGASNALQELGWRRLLSASVTTGAFVAQDSGKIVWASGGVTVPNATMADGDVVVIQENTGAAQTITASITTLRQTGTANVGNRTLKAWGRASIIFKGAASTLAFITGDVT